MENAFEVPMNFARAWRPDFVPRMTGVDMEGETTRRWCRPRSKSGQSARMWSRVWMGAAPQGHAGDSLQVLDVRDIRGACAGRVRGQYEDIRFQGASNSPATLSDKDCVADAATAESARDASAA